MSTSISFKDYVANHAYGRGDEARAELAKLSKKFPEYKDERQFGKNFPVLTKRYQAYLKRANATPRKSKAA